MDFSGKQVVVTGGTGALGSAVVGALLAGGASCVVPYVHDAEAQRFPHRGDPNVMLVAVSDLADETQVAKVYAGRQALGLDPHRRWFCRRQGRRNRQEVALMAQIDSNLTSCFLCCRAAVNAMLAAGGGRIVNVAARPALEWRSGAGMTAYSVAKTGVAALTVALAEEVAKDGILVNAVAPSIMDTPPTARPCRRRISTLGRRSRRWRQRFVFLASPDNRVTRGAIVPVYGKS